MLDTHAWGVRAECYDKVLAALRKPANVPNGRLPATDVTLARMHADIPSYATWPNTAWQQESHSDLAVGSCSNYEVDGWQRPGYNAVAGLLAEMLGGRAWPEARQQAIEEKAWFNRLPKLLNGSSPRPGETAPMENENKEDKKSDGKASAEKIAFLFLTRQGHHHADIWEEYWSGNKDYTAYSHIADAEAHPG